MTEREQLLAAIIAHPGEDTPRLVFADWCDENGDGARAAFIRESIGRKWRDTFEEGIGAYLPKIRPKNGTRLYSQSEKATFLHLAPALPGIAWTVRRGFAEGVTCTSERWAQCADQLIAEYPIQSVELTTPISQEWIVDRGSLIAKSSGRCPEIEVEWFLSINNPQSTTNSIPHILRALWPSIPLDGWTVPAAIGTYVPAEDDDPPRLPRNRNQDREAFPGPPLSGW